MANTIRGNQDGVNGHNDTYRIPGRSSTIPRAQVVQEVKAGKHPRHEIYTRGGVEYVRAKGDSITGNNVDPDQD